MGKFPSAPKSLAFVVAIAVVAQAVRLVGAIVAQRRAAAAATPEAARIGHAVAAAAFDHRQANHLLWLSPQDQSAPMRARLCARSLPCLAGFFLAKLVDVEPVVVAALLEQLAMRAALDDPPAADDENHVRTADRR